ncbi:uncharacterized protein [Dermacentor albipictus]|uniref:uncharacterized protein n=1 Tax=Dermacentor albipictus TaxID=60249 RepID=UPI0038FD05B4
MLTLFLRKCSVCTKISTSCWRSSSQMTLPVSEIVPEGSSHESFLKSASFSNESPRRETIRLGLLYALLLFPRTTSDNPAHFYLTLHRLATHPERQPMPRQRTCELRRRRVPLPRQAIPLTCAGRASAYQVHCRRRSNLTPTDLRHCDIALSRPQHSAFAESRTSDNHGAVGHRSYRLRWEQRRRDTAARELVGSPLSKPRCSWTCDSAGAETAKFVPPQSAGAMTRRRLLRGVMLGTVKQSWQIATGNSWQPPQDHKECFLHRSTPNAFSSCPGGDIEQDTQMPSRRFPTAVAHRAATQAASRQGRRCGFRLKLRPVGNSRAGHRVLFVQSGARCCPSGQSARLAMSLLSGKPPGTGRKAPAGALSIATSTSSARTRLANPACRTRLPAPSAE